LTNPQNGLGLQVEDTPVKPRPYERTARISRQEPRQRAQWGNVLITCLLGLIFALPACYGLWTGLRTVGAELSALPPTHLDVPVVHVAGLVVGDPFRVEQPSPQLVAEAYRQQKKREGKQMANYTGTNAGTSAANGVYTEAGTYNERPYYNGPNGNSLYFRPEMPAWCVGVLGDSTILYAFVLTPSPDTPYIGTYSVWDGDGPGIEISGGGSAGTGYFTLHFSRKCKRWLELKIMGGLTGPVAAGPFSIVWEDGASAEEFTDTDPAYPLGAAEGASMLFEGLPTHTYTTDGAKHIVASVNIGGEVQSQEITVNVKNFITRCTLI
jgi:hypothetical protein